MDEAERLCDTLIVIDHGRKIAEGSRATDRRAHRAQVVEVFDEAGGRLAGFVENHRNLAERVETAAKPRSSTAASRANCSPGWPKPTACATCTARPTSRTCSSN
jgi:ABC-type multidrug transport system ATPase subunit